MTDELSPATRSLLAAAREGLSPDEAAAARVRARVAAVVAGGAAVGAAGAASAHAAASAPAAAAPVAASAAAAPVAASAAAVGGGLAVKLIAVIAVAGGIGGGYAVVSRSSSPAQVSTAAPSPSSTASPAPVAPQPPHVVATPSEPAIDPDIEMTSEHPDSGRPKAGRPQNGHSPAGRRASAGGTATAGTGSPVAPQAAQPSITLAREVELIDQAMSALKNHHPADALAKVRIFETESAGHGQLAEDAAAIGVEALCELHEPSWSERLSDFEHRWPSSAQRSRLRTKCTPH